MVCIHTCIKRVKTKNKLYLLIGNKHYLGGGQNVCLGGGKNPEHATDHRQNLKIALKRQKFLNFQALYCLFRERQSSRLPPPLCAPMISLYYLSPHILQQYEHGRGDNWMKIWICTPRIEPWRKHIETIVIKNLKKLLRFFITTDLYSPFLIYIEWLVPDIWPGCGGGVQRNIIPPLPPYKYDIEKGTSKYFYYFLRIFSSRILWWREILIFFMRGFDLERKGSFPKK